MCADEEKGFKVTDRRLFGGERKEERSAAGEEEPKTQQETAGGRTSDQAPAGQADAATPPEEIPPIDFASFVLSMASSTLIHLGAVPDPLSGQMHPDLTMAKQTIDVLSVLQEKTRGNLTPEEGRILDNLLADLRMRYLKAVKFIS